MAGCGCRSSQQCFTLPLGGCNPPGALLGGPGGGQGGCAYSCGNQPEEEEAGQSGLRGLYPRRAEDLCGETSQRQDKHSSFAGRTSVHFSVRQLCFSEATYISASPLKAQRRTGIPLPQFCVPLSCYIGS